LDAIGILTAFQSFHDLKKDIEMHFAQAGIQSCYLHGGFSADSFQNGKFANVLMQTFRGTKMAK
jgi:hypothetical protein